MVAFFFPPPSGNALRLSFIGETQSGSNTVNIPATPQAGDICVYLQAAGGADSATSFNVPTGYTQMVLIEGGNIGAQAGFKILTGGETQVVTTTSGPDTEVATFCLLFRPDTTIASTAYGTWNEAVSVNGISQSVNPSPQQAPLIMLALASVAGGGNFNFSVQSPAFDNTYGLDTGGCAYRLGYTLYNSTPVTQSVSMGDEGTENCLISGFLAAL
jgi:hypothetical protein